MTMPRLSSLTIALLLATAGTAGAGPAQPVEGERKARLAPVTGGRLAPLMPVTPGLRPITSDRAAGLNPISSGRLAPLMPVTRDRAAAIAPVTRGRAAALAPLTSGRAAALPPLTTGRAASLSPVTTDRAAGLSPITSGRAARLAPVTRGRAAALAPVTRGRAASLTPITMDRRERFEALVLGEVNPPVVAFDDGYLAPFEARELVRSGELAESLLSVESRCAESFRRHGVGSIHRYRGEARRALDTLDPCGPQNYPLRPLGQNVPAGKRVGSFFFPAAYYIRPGGARDRRRAPGARLIIIADDLKEDMPEGYRRRLEKSNFPMVMGDVAFKAGDYVQAALAFQDAADRRPEAAAAHLAFADALIALRNYGYAADELRVGLRLAPTWADDLDRHGVYGEKGHLEKHLAEVEEAASRHGAGADAWLLLGYLRLTSGMPAEMEKAGQAFREVLSRAPEDALARRFLERLTD